MDNGLFTSDDSERRGAVSGVDFSEVTVPPSPLARGSGSRRAKRAAVLVFSLVTGVAFL